MFWHSRMWAGAVALCALGYSTLAMADPATVMVAPAEHHETAVVVPPSDQPTTVVVAPAAGDDWTSFTGVGDKGGHYFSAEMLLNNGDVTAQAEYRYQLTDKVGLGLRGTWGNPFGSSDGPDWSATSYPALNINVVLNVNLLHTKRWSLGLNVAPGLHWFFKECSFCSEDEERAVLLYASLPLLYEVVPHMFYVGAGFDIYADLFIRDTTVIGDLPMMLGPVAEFHVTKNLAITAEAKFGGWLSTSSSEGGSVATGLNQAYFIQRFGIGLAFFGVP